MERDLYNHTLEVRRSYNVVCMVCVGFVGGLVIGSKNLQADWLRGSYFSQRLGWLRLGSSYLRGQEIGSHSDKDDMFL